MRDFLLEVALRLATKVMSYSPARTSLRTGSYDREISRAKYTMLRVLKQFAQEADDPDLLEHVRNREASLRRLEEEARLLERKVGQ